MKTIIAIFGALLAFTISVQAQVAMRRTNDTAWGATLAGAVTNRALTVYLGSGILGTTYVLIDTNGTGRFFIQGGNVGIRDANGDDTLTVSDDKIAGANNAVFHGNASGLTNLPGSAIGSGTVALARGGTGASLTDPNADRILFWDDSAGSMAWLTAGSGLTITDTTITASGSGVSVAAGTNGITAVTNGSLVTISHNGQFDTINASTVNATNLNVQNFNVTNLYVGTGWITNLHALTNQAPVTPLTNLFLLGTRYTNAAQRAWISQCYTGTAIVTLSVEQGNGVTNTHQLPNGIGQLSAFVSPSARYTFSTNGTGAITTITNTASWVGL